MSRIRFLAFAALMLAALGAWAEQVTLMRTVQLPDGHPAVGAVVLVRQYDIASNTVKETRLTTDTQGQFSIALDMVETPRNFPPIDERDGHFLIDMPGYALHCELYNLKRERAPGTPAGIRRPGTNPPVLHAPVGGTDSKIVHLAESFEITGTVTDSDNTPASGALVYVIGLQNGSFGPVIPLNVPGVKVTTPVLTAKTGADGSYHLRGLTASFYTGGATMGMPGVPGGPVPATLAAQSADGTRLGDNDNAIFIRPAMMRADMATRNNLRLSPTISLEGRVTNGATGAPVAGAQVVLRGKPSAALDVIPPTTTDRNGKYRFNAIPSTVRKLFTLCSVNGMSDGWARAYESRTPIVKPLTGIDMTVCPWVDVKGTMIDETTKQTPLTPISITAIYDEGAGDDEFPTLGRQATGCKVNADGTFTLHIPTGSATLRISGAGYGGTDYVTAKLTDNAPLELKVKRLPGIVVRFVSTRQIDWSTCMLQTRNDDGKGVMQGGQTDFQRYGLVHFNPNWGAKLENLQVRIMQRTTEVLPWTPVVADPNKWPCEIQIP